MSDPDYPTLPHDHETREGMQACPKCSVWLKEYEKDGKDFLGTNGPNDLEKLP